MHGLTGYFGGNWINGYEGAKHQLVAMAKTIEHRGPDSGRSWVDVNNFIAFTHNRLSIIDLSANGSRPMYSATKRFVMVVNGEIYNHLNLRSELENI